MAEILRVASAVPDFAKCRQTGSARVDLNV